MSAEAARALARARREHAAADLAEAEVLEAYARGLEQLGARTAPPSIGLAVSQGRRPDSDLARAAHAHGLSLRELARKIGVSSATVAYVATGKRRPSAALVAKLRAAVGWPPE